MKYNKLSTNGHISRVILSKPSQGCNTLESAQGVQELKQSCSNSGLKPCSNEILSMYVSLNLFPPCQIMTIVYRRRATGRLEGFGNFGSIHYRIQEGGHLPYEG